MERIGAPEGYGGPVHLITELETAAARGIGRELIQPPKVLTRHEVGAR
jgi:hypothetical protein